MDLDALLADLQPDAPASLDETRRPDWDAATVRSAEPPAPGDTASLPEPPPSARLSLSPPVAPTPDGPTVPQGPELIVVGQLGQGGMGTVLLARQPALDREVAVKVPNTAASAGTVQALVREARTTGSLEHPGIVPVHAIAFDHLGTPALVMKRIDGVSWATLLKEPGHPAWRFVESRGRDRLEIHVQLLMQVCNAVAFAHRQGVLHRDIKPANVLVGEFGEVYLADWGVATRKPLPGEERKKGLVGTPLYFAPEMVLGDDTKMDERTDVYLLGATLYQALCGWPPHPGQELKQVLEHAWAGEVRPLPDEVPKELRDVVARALARDPAQRFESATALREALAQFLRHRGSNRLASAALTRLAVLEAELQLPAPLRERVSPLVSECRFGFMQAQGEWPDNPVARDGLERTARAAAWFEVKAGNAPAARALLAELKTAPGDLVAAIRALELDDEKSELRKAHLDRLGRELDPRVALRQRVLLFVGLSAAILLAAALPSLTPVWSSAEASLGPYLLLAKLVPTTVTFFVALLVGRRSLLGTRLNRRVMAMVALCFLGLTLNRVVCAQFGLSFDRTMSVDLVVLAVIAAAAGLVLHWGFFITMGANLLGIGAALAGPSTCGGSSASPPRGRCRAWW